MSNFEQMSEAVLVSLEKLGPSSPKAIAADTGIKKARLQQVLAQMLEDRSLKAAGARRSRVYALPAQDLPAAAGPAASRAPKKKTKRVRKAQAKKPARRAYTKRAKPRKATRGARPGPDAIFARWTGPAAGATPRRTPEETRDILDDFNRRMDDALGGSFGRLRIAFVEHLAAITDTQRRLFGAPKREEQIARGLARMEPLTGFGSEPEPAGARGNGSAGAH